ncbi:MAG: 50S ribosomal protein L32e [Candidatus Pacearchaeota archaeon]|nr:50S ribosomal protein L32e [Candidatus Pacearchaeota archaeon]
MNIKTKPLFLRKDSNKKIRIGRRKKSRWRKQKGGDSKIRQRMKSYRKTPSIGYGADKESYGLIRIAGKTLQPVIIHNALDLNKIEKNQIAIIAHTSKKNKIEIAKRAQEKGIKIANLNVKKTLKSVKKQENKTPSASSK